jgi:hypothetical protein
MMVSLKHKETGVNKELKLGFSWTIFFFGALVFVFRGNWSEFFKYLILGFVTFRIYDLIQCFTANKKEVIRWMERGYVPANDADRQKLVNKGIL